MTEIKDKNKIKISLYKEKPIAHRVDEDNEYLYYSAFLDSEQEVKFKIPRDESVDVNGKLIFESQEESQLLIRWLE